MKLSITAVLLLSAVLLTGTEAGWVRKTLRTAGDITKKVITNEAIKGISDIVKTVGPGLAVKALGKRSVDWRSMLGKAGGVVAKDLLRELELACTQYPSLKGKQGLTANDLSAAFVETDGNKDGSLNGEELDLFENVVDAVQHCLGTLKTSNPFQGK